MSRLYSIGELLIDFQSVGTKSLKETNQFIKNAGGAPANVCVQAVKLGQKASYLTKVGNDGFGDFLIESLKKQGVDVRFISKSDQYDTSLAFVSFSEDGEREFTFYRKMAADLHFSIEDFQDVLFEKGDILEFGSVALKTMESRTTHKCLINMAIDNGAWIAFDPNLRFNLWENKNELKEIVCDFIQYADIVKVGLDELEFILNLPEQEAVAKLFNGRLKMLLITNGSKGAKLYLKDGRSFYNAGYSVKTVDTTGAGDSFFGAFLAQILEEQTEYNFESMLSMACKCGAYTTTGFGAIPAMGTKEEVLKEVK